jgi:hypothetical protein
MTRAPTTKMLIARRGMHRALGADAAEWATEQLAQGCDTQHLRQLAGTTGAENTFEIEELFDRTARELGLVIPSPEDAIVDYARELARDYLDHRISREQLLYELCDLCISTDYKKELYPFYLLRWTHDDLKENTFSFYRRDATRENFESLLRTEITLLAGEHQKA